jgi:hypothetical protein
MEVENLQMGVTICHWDLLAFKLTSGKCDSYLQIDLFFSPLFFNYSIMRVTR